MSDLLSLRDPLFFSLSRSSSPSPFPSLFRSWRLPSSPLAFSPPAQCSWPSFSPSRSTRRSSRSSPSATSPRPRSPSRRPPTRSPGCSSARAAACSEEEEEKKKKHFFSIQNSLFPFHRSVFILRHFPRFFASTWRTTRECFNRESRGRKESVQRPCALNGW